MPAHLNVHTEGYQTFISTYSIDSIVGSFLEVASLKFWVNSAAIPDTAPFDLTTTTLNAFLPGIAGYYGANLPVDVRVQFFELGQVGITEANEEMTGVATLELEFWVEKTDGTKEMAAAMRLIDTDFGFKATVTDMRLLISLTQVNVSNVSILSCTFGRLSALLIRTELNNGFRLF